jgi:broad specificity phosphatase PhoE
LFEIIEEPDYGGALSRTMVYIAVSGEPNDESNNLSERGKQQVFELARSRLIAAPSKMYSDSSDACTNSAEIIAKELYTGSSRKDCLCEVNLGTKHPDEQFLKSELTKMWKDLSYAPKGGESLIKSQERISKCIDVIAKTHPESSIGIVLSPIVAALFYRLVAGGKPAIEDWLYSSFASCTTYEYSKNGWSLVMPPESSFLSEPSNVIDTLPKGVF